MITGADNDKVFSIFNYIFISAGLNLTFAIFKNQQTLMPTNESKTMKIVCLMINIKMKSLYPSECAPSSAVY